MGSWNAGQIAFFSGLSVVNLDGLVNDQVYALRLKEQLPVMDYIRSQGIGYIADYDGPDLSMPPQKRWNSGRRFRGELPRKQLKLVHRELPGGKTPRTIQLLKVLPPGRSRGGGETASQGTKR